MLRAGDSGVQVRVRVSLLANVAAHLLDPRDPWHRHVGDRLRGRDVPALQVLAAHRPRLPGLVVPVGECAGIEAELEALGDARLRTALGTVWRRAYAPLATTITELLERERLAMGATLAKDGPHGALARAHPGLEARGCTVVLVPLLARSGAVHVDPGHAGGTLIAYAAPGAEHFWEAAAAGDGLAALLGATRARVATCVHTPRTTGDVARLLGVSPSLASQHLSALRERGLVDRRRDGRHALHQLTPFGRRVCDAMRA